jgi:hypothetical protein
MTASVRNCVVALDWAALAAELDTKDCATTDRLFTAAECKSLANEFFAWPGYLV